MAVSPDGVRLTSGHRHGGIKLWDLASGRELASVAGHRGRVSAIAFSADGKRLASSGEHGQIRVWPLVPR